MKKQKLSIIGTGVMGSIFIDRLLETKTLSRKQILVNDHSLEKIKETEDEYGVVGFFDKKKMIEESNIILLAVKPQNFKDLALEIKTHIKINKKMLVLSIMAGVDIKSIQKLLGIKEVVRVMPNLPAKIGQGVLVWQAASAVSQVQKQQTKLILQSLGKEIEVNDEKYIDMATAISGSGPAYVFLFQELFANASQKLGLPKKIAEELVRETVWGAINLQRKLKVSPELLRKQVTSKGGTTAAALDVFKKNNTEKIFNKAVQAAYKRSQELKKG